MRRTKIVCTIGPASESKEKIDQLLEAGMDVARLNFSHGTHEEHASRITSLREEAAKLGKHLAVLLDTKGPEIRTGIAPNEGIKLENDKFLILDTQVQQTGTDERVGITYKNLWQEVQPSNHILLDDGQIDLEVVKIEEELITTVIRNGGLLTSHKGVNVPYASLQFPAITDKDVDDINFGLRQGIDFIAASFTRKAEDVLAVRRILEENNNSEVKIIAKIENREGIKNLDSILEVTDGLMVARGDLGVEIPVEEVPGYQKEMIRKCNLLGKPVIVATQMLDSMIRQPRPTRAEASDVANAILDGTDAIMLSGETAAGKFPVEAVKMMDRIARKTETDYLDSKSTRHPQLNVAESISYASCTIASDLAASAILTPTHSGQTARMISKYRPKAIIIGATPYLSTARHLSLQWGVFPLLVPESSGTDQLMSTAVNAALTKDLIHTGDIVVITAGVPVGKVGSTNMIKVQVVGNVLLKGTGVGRRSYSGISRIILSSDENQQLNPGDILITKSTDAKFNSLIAKAGALVVEEAGLTSHAAIAALQYGVPTIVGAHNATEKLSEGSLITVDALTGIVYDGAVAIL